MVLVLFCVSAGMLRYKKYQQYRFKQNVRGGIRTVEGTLKHLQYRCAEKKERTEEEDLRGVKEWFYATLSCALVFDYAKCSTYWQFNVEKLFGNSPATEEFMSLCEQSRRTLTDNIGRAFAHCFARHGEEMSVPGDQRFLKAIPELLQQVNKMRTLLGTF
jgi:hypothetical protein